MIKVGIVGATGYVGAELVRILLNHKKVEIVALSSVSYKGEKFSSVYKNYRGKMDMILGDEDQVVDEAQVIFTALPHGLSEDIALKCINQDKICIDLGADFRLKDEKEYKEWYGKNFIHSSIHKDSVYGLPELNRSKIKESKLIGNPGCYPTSIELGLFPLLKNDLIETNNIICDSKSGTTGAGRSLTLNTHFPEENEIFAPYKIGAHRHTPEIEQILGEMKGEKVGVTFTPHLLPINRGIVSTIYCSSKKEINLKDIHRIYEEFYKEEPFVDVLPLGEVSSIKGVRFTNKCEISIHKNHRGDGLIIVSSIDNMIKGAAGQAIQNMNIIFGFDEKEGLDYISPAF